MNRASPHRATFSPHRARSTLRPLSSVSPTALDRSARHVGDSFQKDDRATVESREPAGRALHEAGDIRPDQRHLRRVLHPDRRGLRLAVAAGRARQLAAHRPRRHAARPVAAPHPARRRSSCFAALREIGEPVGVIAWRGIVFITLAPIIFGLTVRGLGFVGCRLHHRAVRLLRLVQDEAACTRWRSRWR